MADKLSPSDRDVAVANLDSWSDVDGRDAIQKHSRSRISIRHSAS